MPRFFATEFIGKSNISWHFCRCNTCKRLTLTYNFTPAYPQLLVKKWIRAAMTAKNRTQEAGLTDGGAGFVGGHEGR